MTAMAAKREDIFAANRAVGRVALSVKCVDGKTRRGEVHEAGSLRVRCPGAVSYTHLTLPTICSV